MQIVHVPGVAPCSPRGGARDHFRRCAARDLHAARGPAGRPARRRPRREGQCRRRRHRHDVPDRGPALADAARPAQPRAQDRRRVLGQLLHPDRRRHGGAAERGRGGERRPDRRHRGHRRGRGVFRDGGPDRPAQRSCRDAWTRSRRERPRRSPHLCLTSSPGGSDEHDVSRSRRQCAAHRLRGRRHPDVDLRSDLEISHLRAHSRLGHRDHARPCARLFRRHRPPAAKRAWPTCRRWPGSA